MIKALMLYLLIINVIGVLIMYVDKQKAKRGQYRIPEATLWKVAFAGGAVGTTIGMKIFRHKTKHTSFKVGFPAVALLESALVFYFVFV